MCLKGKQMCGLTKYSGAPYIEMSRIRTFRIAEAFGCRDPIVGTGKNIKKWRKIT